jgi:hypothetical protein
MQVRPQHLILPSLTSLTLAALGFSQFSGCSELEGMQLEGPAIPATAELDEEDDRDEVFGVKADDTVTHALAGKHRPGRGLAAHEREVGRPVAMKLGPRSSLRALQAAGRRTPGPGLTRGAAAVAGAVPAAVAAAKESNAAEHELVVAPDLAEPYALIGDEPQIEIKTFLANGIPASAQDAGELSDCTQPKTEQLATIAKNVFGVAVVEVEYAVAFQYRCRHGGHGAYIANARVYPTRVFALWGFGLDFRVEKVTVTNVGTAEAPVANLALHTRIDLRSPFSSDAKTQIVELDGATGAVHTH